MPLSINSANLLQETSFLEHTFGFLGWKEASKNAVVSKVFKKAVDNFYKPHVLDKTGVLSKHTATCVFGNHLEYRTSLALPSGILISWKDFCNNPLFKNTKIEECKKVFHCLLTMTINNEFKIKYKEFLDCLKLDNWFEECRSEPIKLSLFSIIAFFDKTINLEELSIIHAVCEAYQALKEELPKDSLKVIKVTPKVVSADEVADYLTKAGIPPFAENVPKYIITKRKSEEELFEIINECIETFREEKSVVERTFLEYTLSPFNLRKMNYAAEPAIHFKTSSELGFINIGNNEATIVLPPIKLVEHLFRSTSKFGIGKPNYMFGYNPKGSKKGDPVSLASRFFSIPYVHGFTEGPKKLAILTHDILYHIPLRANNPHVSIFKKIGRSLLKADLSSFPDDILKYFTSFAEKIIDCEANIYRIKDPKEAFWLFLNKLCEDLNTEVLSYLGFYMHRHYKGFLEKYLDEIFMPSVMQALEESNIAESIKPEISPKESDECIIQ